MGQAREIIETVQTAVEEIVKLRGNVFEVYDAAKFVDFSEDLTAPCVGVMYVTESATSSETRVKSLNTEIRVGIFILAAREGDGVKCDFLDALDLGEEIFDKMSTLTSPKGQPYRFVNNVPQDAGIGLAYIQTWAITIMHC